MSDHDSHSIYDSDESEPTRPNRFDGPSYTWQTLTEQERGLAASLDQLRNQDLSIHLYNAHALKIRGRAQARLNKESVSKASSESEDEEAKQSFKPPKSWTAWPLPPDIVPREGEHIGPEDQDEIYTLKKREREMPSRYLEDVLLGVTLKYAKERFEARDWDEEDFEEGAAEDDVAAGEKKAFDQDGDSPMDGPADSPLDGDEATSQNILKRSSEPPPETKLLRPVISVDDERSREILRPSIRHNLSMLDEVLMALHHARKTCSEYTTRNGSSRADSTRPESRGSSWEEEKEGVKSPMKGQGRGRPRKHANLPERPRVGEDSNNPSVETPAELWRAKPTRIGRPRKQYERLEGETEQDYLIRVARMQKKPLPAFAPPRVIDMPDSPRSPPPRKTPRKNLVPERAKVRHERHLGLRDWSEVLGSAALVGFSPEVVARATQRCANLFGESMTMRTLIEAPFTLGKADHVIEYKPEKIPELDKDVDETVEIFSDNESGDAESDSSSSESKPTFVMGARTPKGRVSLQQHYFCPLVDCHRHTAGFSDLVRVYNHMKRGHKMTAEQMNELLFGGGEAMEGAVHVDGWMKPLNTIKRGARGKDRKERKKGRWAKGLQEVASKSDTETSDTDSDSEDSQDDGQE